MFNQVILTGRLARDPELRENNDGNKRASICLAVQRPFKQRGSEQFKTDFFYITVWEGIAETIYNSAKKGTVMIVKGRLETSNYVDKSGKKVYAMTIIGERIVYLGHNLSKEELEIDEEIEVEPDLKSVE